MAANMIGARIKEAREARNFSASDLARLTGVTPTAVWNWERNGTKPRANALASICKALDVTEAYILSGDSHVPSGGAVKHVGPNRLDPILTAAASQIAQELGIGEDRVKVKFEVVQG